MGVRSRRVVTYSSTTAGWQTMFTVPSGRVLVMRLIEINNVGGTAFSVGWGLRPAGLSTDHFIEPQASLAGLSVRRDANWRAFNPGDAIRLYTLDSHAVVDIYGALLLGEPS